MGLWSGLSPETQVAAAAAIFAALLSGLISIFSVIVAFRLMRKHDQLVREQELKARRDIGARIGLGKLTAMTNKLYSIDKHFTEQFRTATEEGGVVIEPALAITPIVTGVAEVERLTAGEMEFLYFSNSGSLTTKVQLFQSRVATDFASVAEISRQRSALDEFVLRNGTVVGEPDGAAVTTEFDERTGAGTVVMVGTLNRLIASTVVKVEADLAEGLKLIERYRVVGEEVFGKKFPKIQNTGADDEA